jgi:Transposase DDE domain
MCQPDELYSYSPALQLLDPWMRKHLPKWDETATRRLIQLAAGMLERKSVLIEEIARATAFNAAEQTSNETQVRRILRDERISLKTMYYPFIKRLLGELQTDVLYLVMDETTHNTDYCLFQISLATDGFSIPLGFFQYDIDAAWADDARELLNILDRYIPEHFTVILLADRIHTGDPFLNCLDALGWEYVFRAPEDTYIETSKGWKKVQSLYKRKNVGRFLQNVRVWKGSTRRANISVYKYARPGFRAVNWYLISSLPACMERFAEYACRWWQECTFKDIKSALFNWERGRVLEPERVEVLLIGLSCALWVMWMLGRSYEHIPKRKPTTTTPQKRRKSIIKQGIDIFEKFKKKKTDLVLEVPPRPRVLDYERTFGVS